VFQTNVNVLKVFDMPCRYSTKVYWKSKHRPITDTRYFNYVHTAMHVLYTAWLRKTVEYRIPYPTPFKPQTSSSLVSCVPSPLKRH